MNMTMELVVAAIVILIVALVVITIFGGSVTPIGGMTSAYSICKTQCTSSCQMSDGKSMPLTWELKTVKDASGNMMECSKAGSGLCSGTCDSCCQGWKTGTSGGGTAAGTKDCTIYTIKAACENQGCRWAPNADGVTGKCS
jgi:hypothetical protein